MRNEPMLPVAERPAPTKPAQPTTQPAKSSLPSRTAVNFLLDTALLLVFLALVWISVVLRFVFPAGTAADGWLLWGYGFDEWADFQFALLCVFSLGVLVHLMLHWSWICGVVSSRLARWRRRTIRLDDGTQTLYGVGLLIVALNIVGLLIAAAALTIHAP